ASAQQVGAPGAVAFVQIVDLDGVGGLDVVTQTSLFVAEAKQGFDVFLGAGDGGFAQAASVSATGTGMSAGLDVADIDRDRRPDILPAPPAAALVALGHGDGGFDPVVPIPIAGGSVYTAEAVDVDADGYPDLVGGGTSFAQRLGDGLQ